MRGRDSLVEAYFYSFSVVLMPKEHQLTVVL